MEVKSRIADGERPCMPTGKAELDTNPEVWGMLAKCWETEVAERITISGVLNFLEYK